MPKQQKKKIARSKTNKQANIQTKKTELRVGKICNKLLISNYIS